MERGEGTKVIQKRRAEEKRALVSRQRQKPTPHGRSRAGVQCVRGFRRRRHSWVQAQRKQSVGFSQLGQGENAWPWGFGWEREGGRSCRERRQGRGGGCAGWWVPGGTQDAWSQVPERWKTSSKSDVLETILVFSRSRAMVLSAAPGSGARAPPGTLAEMQVLWPHPRPTESESLGVWPATWVFTSPSDVLTCAEI